MIPFVNKLNRHDTRLIRYANMLDRWISSLISYTSELIRRINITHIVSRDAVCFVSKLHIRVSCSIVDVTKSLLY